MAKQYILAIDQGTTSCRAILFDKDSRVAGMAQKEFTQYYPRPGWVEHDPDEIWSAQVGVIAELFARHNTGGREIDAIGVTNQRETTLVWEKASGRPIYPAIVWQCRRTAEICDELAARGLADMLRQKTGLVLDAYFSATKLKWILDNVDGARARAERGELLFGTVDTWLTWKLTGGKAHVTDCSNASRTMLYNIRDMAWDEEILAELDIPAVMLPEVKDSSGFFAETDPGVFFGYNIPITGIAGDQQAALFGQACFESGMCKNTYGTGCFMLMNTGDKLYTSKANLLSTVAWSIGGRVNYALEGSVFVGGAVVQWLRDELKLVETAADSEYFAAKVADNGGVYMVPAFTGLGAPHWDMRARGAIFGLTRGHNKNHLIRAALEAIAYQTKDILTAMEDDSGIRLKMLKVDGGAVQNNLLMQFQADILGVAVERPRCVETTALGAAYLAGLSTGFWAGPEELTACGAERRFEPQMPAEVSAGYYRNWQKAVSRVKDWCL
ncbi:MAG: glycerol kinase GlpK [Gracilibacteraceae bacterium]|jgi:glycerol kinase|nr:glycerol kinase GlpK [Gracilibacteraceae bacterium]